MPSDIKSLSIVPVIDKAPSNIFELLHNQGRLLYRELCGLDSVDRLLNSESIFMWFTKAFATFATTNDLQYVCFKGKCFNRQVSLSNFQGGI